MDGQWEDEAAQPRNYAIPSSKGSLGDPAKIPEYQIPQADGQCDGKELDNNQDASFSLEKDPKSQPQSPRSHQEASQKKKDKDRLQASIEGSAKTEGISVSQAESPTSGAQRGFTFKKVVLAKSKKRAKPVPQISLPIGMTSFVMTQTQHPEQRTVLVRHQVLASTFIKNHVCLFSKYSQAV